MVVEGRRGRDSVTSGDAYTLMGDTPKRMNPEQRGRFNMGEKEILSHRPLGQHRNHRDHRGVPGDRGEIAEEKQAAAGNQGDGHDALGRRGGRAPDPADTNDPAPRGKMDYRVNRKQVQREKELRIHSVILNTIIQEDSRKPDAADPAPHRHPHPAGPGGHWVDLRDGHFPIQEVELSYSVDVMQKVPMPPNRDTVSESIP